MGRKKEDRQALVGQIEIGRLLPKGVSIWAGHKRFHINNTAKKASRTVELLRGDVVLRNARLVAKSKKPGTR